MVVGGFISVRRGKEAITTGASNEVGAAIAILIPGGLSLIGGTLKERKRPLYFQAKLAPASRYQPHGRTSLLKPPAKEHRRNPD